MRTSLGRKRLLDVFIRLKGYACVMIMIILMRRKFFEIFGRPFRVKTGILDHLVRFLFDILTMRINRKVLSRHLFNNYIDC